MAVSHAASEVPAHAHPPVWRAGRVVSVVLGSLLALLALGLIGGGTTALVWAAAHRQDGYVTSDEFALHSDGYALTSPSLRLAGWDVPRAALGDVRVRAEVPGGAVFIGIARTEDVRRYLSGVAYSEVHDLGHGRAEYRDHIGGAPVTAPAQAGIWAAVATGTGQRTLNWTPRSGAWTFVVMRADGTARVAVRADVGATVPALNWVAGAALVAGALAGVSAALLIAIPVRRAGRELARHDRGSAQWATGHL